MQINEQHNGLAAGEMSSGWEAVTAFAKEEWFVT